MRRHSSRSRHLTILGSRRKGRAEKVRPLGEVLVQAGVLTWEELEIVLAYHQGMSPRRLGGTLVALGLASERNIAQALATQLDLPFVDLASLSPDDTVTRRVPRQIAFRHHVVPLRHGDGWIELAMADPTNEAAVDAVRRATGADDVRIRVATVTEVGRACDRIYSRLAAADRSLEPAALAL